MIFIFVVQKVTVKLEPRVNVQILVYARKNACLGGGYFQKKKKGNPNRENF